MDSSTYADDVYQPQEDGGQTGERFPDMADALDEPNDDAILDSGYSPPEHPRVLGRFGTTEAEAHVGETLAERVRQEVPEISGEDGLIGADGECDSADSDYDDPEVCAGQARAGRIVVTEDAECMDVGVDGGAASAEEAAMHIVGDVEAPL